MKRRLGMLVLCGTLLGGGVASARDLSGTLGVGGSTTLGGISGFNAIYWIGHIGLDFNLGIAYFSPSTGESQTAFGLSAGALYRLLTAEDAYVALGGRLNFASVDAGSSVSQINFDAPFRVAYLFTDNFSVHADVGLTIALIPTEGTVLYPTGGSMGGGEGTEFLINSGVLGGAGFDFIF